jgi:VIT1/CCC1 family predicted Fe2+/Mn2+ transporter
MRRSLHASIGDVAFGMEDGAVSIAGLVFGVAASTSNSQIVLLAGATGAAAGAVSMMAGTYLDVESNRDRADALIARARDRLARDPAAHGVRVTNRLQAAGFSPDEAATVTAALTRNPEAMLAYVAAFELGIGRDRHASPTVHALWMFAADLVAAATPVIPFAIFTIGTARVVSLVLTAALLTILGIARARIARRSVIRMTAQTLAIAGAAGAAGVVIGRLVTG